METIIRNKWLIVGALIFIALDGYFVLQNNWWFGFVPFALILVYFTYFKIEEVFLLLALLAPLSINIEDFTNGKIGLFLPTEPILVFLLLLVVFFQLKKSFLPKELIKNPIIWAVAFYLFWTLITSITSVLPIVSFKFLLMRLWYFVPILIFGIYVFRQTKRIKLFFWLYIIAMCAVIAYTTINHSFYGFGEKESHWVMFPFFKDHTSYGAMCAFIVPLIVLFYFSKKQSPLMQLIYWLVFVIALIGLYFSFSRAAWLSIVVSILVGLFIKFKVKFKYLAAVGLTLLILILANWTKIDYLMSENTSEHTTENFEKRLQSAANITTDASNLERINRWTSAWSMFLEKPVFGFGPGTYAFEYAPYQDPDNKTIISTNFGNKGNAHSEYLGPLAEMGLFGLIAFTFIVAMIFYKSITLYVRYSAGEERQIILALILALTTYFIHAFLNDFLDMDKVAIPVWGAVAAIIALEIKLEKQTKSID